MLISVTRSTITIVARPGWTDRRFDYTLRSGGIDPDEMIELEYYENDGFEETWILGRECGRAVTA